jgi:hypothetical protein
MSDNIPPIGGARQRAMERLRLVLREQYAVELAASIAAYEPALPSTFICPPPEADAIFISRTTDPGEAVRNHGVIITMAPGSSRRPRERYTGGPASFKILTELEVDVALAYDTDMQDVPIVGGVPLEEDELMHLRGELYSAALINALHKYACAGEIIHDIELVDDYPPEVLEDKQGVWGLVMITFRLTQFVLVPSRRRLP